MASKYPILDSGYGVLNPTYGSLTKKNYDTEEAGFFGLARKTIKDNLGTSETIGLGPMVGVVLRNEGYTNIKGSMDPTHYIAAAGNIIEENISADGNSLVQIRVRIPEIHSSLPIPSDLPDVSATSSDHDIINLYPVFVAQTSDLSDPAPGSLVWVDFQNRETMKGPTYIAPVDPSALAPPRSERISPVKAFEKNLQDIVDQGYVEDDINLVPLSLQGRGYKFKQSTIRRQGGAFYFQAPITDAIKHIAASYERRLVEIIGEKPHYEYLILGDGSSEKGGSLKPHSSHQVGEDADIGTPWNTIGDKNRDDRFQNFPVNIETVNKEAILILFEEVFKVPDELPGTPKIDNIFLSKKLKNLIGSEILQIKNASSSKAARITFPYNDADHFHIRFKTPKKS